MAIVSIQPCCKLFSYGRRVLGPLHLLDHNENGLTFGLGYVLSMSRWLLRDLLAELGVKGFRPNPSHEFRLQERSSEGITDLELHAGDLHVVFEAKKASWPGVQQLKRYAGKLRDLKGRKLLCPLGSPPLAASPARNWQPGGGIELRHVRWTDVLRTLLRAAKRGSEPHLDQYITLMREVIAMQTYDREVLVRDVGWNSYSFLLYLRHHMYACQITETAEPLFFAPCFSGEAEPALKGIHYVSRVYCRSAVVPADRDTLKDALDQAQAVVRKKTETLAGKKTAKEQVAYLRGLPQHWKRGLKNIRATKKPRSEELAVFFLGQPMPLPRPVFKKGKMVPVGFSLSLEQLMKGTDAVFRC